jgi:ribose 5-phosphate isomerase RpiB
MYDEGAATRFVDVFLAPAFSGGERHTRRIAQISRYEQNRQGKAPLRRGFCVNRTVSR